MNKHSSIASVVPVSTSTESVWPSARCHGCSSRMIEAVCSRCGRMLCREHELAAGPPRPGLLLDLFRGDPIPDDEEEAVKPKSESDRRDRSDKSAGAAPGEPAAPSASDENGDSDQAATGDTQKWVPANTVRDEARSGKISDADGRVEPPAGSAHRRYCADCVPLARPFDAEAIAATTTTGLGAAVLPVHSVLGGVLMAAGVVRLCLRIIAGIRRRRAAKARTRSTALALNPNVRKVEAKERIRGSARFAEDRRCASEVIEVIGTVKLEGTWSRRHRTRLDEHRRRTGTEPSTVRAGHLILHGPARVRFRPTPAAQENSGPALVLRPIVADHPVLSEPGGHGDARWRPEFEYEIAPPQAGWKLPVWVTPNIAADLDQHVLELHVQWSTRGPERSDRGNPLRSIEILEIFVPGHWGDVEYMISHGGDTFIERPIPDGSGEFGLRKLTWKKVPCSNPADRGQLRLAVRFSDRIDLGHVLQGRIEARFKGAVSEITRIDLYRSDGAPARLSGSRKPITSVEVDLELSLHGLRYQEHRAVPDQARAEDVSRKETQHFPTLVPDHRTVALLTNNLAEEGYYIIRVQENPAQASLRAKALNRLWDLAGRHYEGVYPIDFHLVLSGEEVHRGAVVSGETAISLTVHGSYANPTMEQRVIEEWTRLWKRIRLCAEAAAHGEDGGPRAADQPLDAASSELARLRNLMVTVTAELSDAVDRGEVTRVLGKDMVERLTTEFDLHQGNRR